MGWELNKLEGYYQVAWNWKWNIGMYTIAETARTSIIIKSVTVDRTEQPTNRTRNFGYSSIEMKLFEPGTSALLDYMSIACQMEGYQNQSQVDHDLAVRFCGFDEGGNPVDNITGEEWNMTCQLVQMHTSINESGSEYQIVFAPRNQAATNDQIAVIPTVGQMKDPEDGNEMETVGDVIEKVVEILNKTAENKWGSGYLDYAIDFENWPSDPESWKIVPEKRQENSEVTDIGSRIGVGQDIGEFINNLLSCTKEGVQAITPDDDDEEEGGYNKEYILAAKVIPDITYGEFFQKWNSYGMEVRYKIIPFKTTKVVLTSQQSDAVASGEYALRSYSFLQGEGRCKKQYHYIYTGKNTDIIKCELNFNLLYQRMVMNFYGARHYEAFNEGRKTFPDKHKERVWNREKAEEVEDATGGGSHPESGGSGGSDLYIEDIAFGQGLPIQEQVGYDTRNSKSQVDNQSESNMTYGKAKYGRALEQINADDSGDLVNIDLEIRGDPYWLGSDKPSSTESESSGSPNYNWGDVAFGLIVKIPVMWEEDIGLPQLTSSVQFSGIYRVITVKNHFHEDGKFTQTIHGTKIPNSDLAMMQ